MVSVSHRQPTIPLAYRDLPVNTLGVLKATSHAGAACVTPADGTRGWGMAAIWMRKCAVVGVVAVMTKPT